MMETQTHFDVKAINYKILANAPILLNYFGIPFADYKNRYAFSCPIHSSDTSESASIFKTGESKDGNFVCWTRHCETEIGYNVYSLFKYLSHKKHPTMQYHDWLLSNKIDIDKCSKKQLELMTFSNFVKKHFQSSHTPQSNIQTREYARSKLIIPSQYFVKRGYKPETLNKFDVGLCITRGSSAYMRATVPVYDITGQFMIGYTARSINDECNICGKFHYFKHPCPRNKIEENFARKWRHSEGFAASLTLYNIWHLNSKTCILVEGPGDVWKLYEAGYKNGLALFGCAMTQAQVEQLITKGVENVVLCLDNDVAGEEAIEKIHNRLKYYFNVEVITPTTKKDLGDSSVEEIHNLFKGIRWKLLE